MPGENGAFAADDDLTWEYRRLFIARAQSRRRRGARYTPIASAWCSVRPPLSCAHGCVNTGVARTADEKTPEDHIGLMLALMAWLAQNQPADLNEFLGLHFLTWAGHFLDELADAAEHPFYEGLARLTRASLDGVQKTLELEVVVPRFYR